jgi:hypothetical protein
VETLPRITALDCRAVRRRFEQRFSADRMARDYVNVYRSLLTRERSWRGQWTKDRDSSRVGHNNHAGDDRTKYRIGRAASAANPKWNRRWSEQ